MHEMQMIFFFLKKKRKKKFFEIFCFLFFFFAILQRVYKTNKQTHTSLNNEAFQPYSSHKHVQSESLVLSSRDISNK